VNASNNSKFSSTGFRYTATKGEASAEPYQGTRKKSNVIEIPDEEKTVHFSFPQPKPSGRIVAEFSKRCQSYSGHLVVRPCKFHDRARRTRIALVGVNGAGKSTLIKFAGGVPSRSAPENSSSATMSISINFAQDQYKELDPESAPS